MQFLQKVGDTPRVRVADVEADEPNPSIRQAVRGMCRGIPLDEVGNCAAIGQGPVGSEREAPGQVTARRGTYLQRQP